MSEVRSGHQVKIQIENLSLSFGGVKALTDVSLDIRDNEILAIIGPNGAGKTCLLNCINGFYKPQKGEIYTSLCIRTPSVVPSISAGLTKRKLNIVRQWSASSISWK